MAPAGPPADAAGAATARPLILNYWTHLNEILQSEQARRRTRTMRPTGEFIVRIGFPFDNLAHLRAKHLLRAANEGAAAARTAAWGRPEAEARGAAYVNIATALEYYPLLAAGDDDFMPLLYLMGNDREDPVLRLFLISRTVPGLAPPSLFSRYFQEQIGRMDPFKFREYLAKPASHPLEDPEVQVVAIQALYAFNVNNYTAILRRDPKIAAWARGVREPVTPSILLREDAPALSGDTAYLAADMNSHFASMARDLANHLKPGSNRPPAVRAVAREYLQRIYDEIPLEDRAAVKALLDAAAPAPVS